MPKDVRCPGGLVVRWPVGAVVLVAVVMLSAAVACAPGDVSGQDDPQPQAESLLGIHGLHPTGDFVERTGDAQGWQLIEASAADASRAIGMELPPDVEPPLSLLSVELEERWRAPGDSVTRAVTAFFLVVDGRVVGAWLTVDELEGGVSPLNSLELTGTGASGPGT